MPLNPFCFHATGCQYPLSFLNLPFNFLSLLPHQNQSLSNELVRFQCSSPKLYYPALSYNMQLFIQVSTAPTLMELGEGIFLGA